MKKILFIHVPKTAGTALKIFFNRELGDFFNQANSAAQLAEGNQYLGPVKDLSDIRRILDTHTGLSLHVDSNFDTVRRTSDFRSLTPYIFDAKNIEYFRQFTILTMFRQPFRRFLSDYAFVRRMKADDPGFLPNLNLTTVESYLHQIHPNPVLHFLLEADLHRPRTITRDDLEWVKDRMTDYPIHTGIYERFDESVSMFARVMERDFRGADVPALNTGKAPPEVDPSLEAAFYERNALDVELYDHAAGQFERTAQR